MHRTMVVLFRDYIGMQSGFKLGLIGATGMCSDCAASEKTKLHPTGYSVIVFFLNVR